MGEDFDLTNAFETLKGMLNSEDGKKQIENIVSQFGGGNCEEESPVSDDMEMLLKIKQIMSAANKAENSRSTELLRSLAPLLKPSKREQIEKAVKLMNMSKIINIMKEMG